MGYSHWSGQDYSKVSASRRSQDRKQIFKTSRNVDPDMDPRTLKVRESRDSDAHPESNAIIVAFDVTGSMGKIPVQFAQDKLGGLMKLLVDEGYIAHPQVLFAAIGDAYTDGGPFQVGQFESGLEMDMWLTRMWLEGGGGGQKRESYGLAHHFAAGHTSVDCWEKRQKKGYLFTMGDEMPWDVPADHVERVFGYRPPADLSMEAVVKQAQATWEVFHIVVAEGHHGRDPEVLDRWRQLLGERALVLPHAEGVCELIGTTIGLMEQTIDVDRARKDMAALGASADTVAAVTGALQQVTRR